MQRYINVRKIYLNNLENLKKQTGALPKESADYLFISDSGRALSPQTARRTIHRLSADAGVECRITPHMFRHTFATLLMEQGVELSYIQKYLGHSSISTTQIYLHISDQAARQMLEDRFPEI